VVKSTLISSGRVNVLVGNLANLLRLTLYGLRTAVVILLEALATWYALVALRLVYEVRLLFTQWLHLMASFARLSGDVSVY
jgi:hypothetical protein